MTSPGPVRSTITGALNSTTSSATTLTQNNEITGSGTIAGTRR